MLITYTYMQFVYIFAVQLYEMISLCIWDVNPLSG